MVRGLFAIAVVLSCVFGFALPSSRSTAIADDTLEKKLERFRANDQAAYHELVEAGEAAIDGLALIMKDEKLGVITRFMAANVLGDIGKKRAVEPLIEALRAPEYNLRRCAALALGKIRDERAKKPLEELAEKDPFVYHDPESGKDLYLVREDARRALDILAGRVAADDSGLVKEKEIFLADATKPPPSPVKVRLERLPFPFKGGFKDQNVFNNYEQPTDAYVHAGLDIMQPPGTEVSAVADGWVALVYTNYPEWKTHHLFIVTTEKEGKDKNSGEGWCYTHVDPDSYTFEIGERIHKGDVLGRVVDFYVGANKGADHLHLHYVRFTRDAKGKVDFASLVDPLLFFDYEDTEKPVIHEPIRFVRAGTLDEFAADKDGIATVSGDVDVIAGISDFAYAGQGCNWMVPVVTIEIQGGKSKPWRKLVMDQRGEVGDAAAATALYVKYEAKQRWLKDVPAFPPIHFVFATHTDGDGMLEKADALQTWSTAERDERGERRFPDGVYQVTLRAFDLKENKAERTVKVRVENR